MLLIFLFFSLKRGGCRVMTEHGAMTCAPSQNWPPVIHKPIKIGKLITESREGRFIQWSTETEIQ